VVLLSRLRFMIGPLAPLESKSVSISEYEGSRARFNRLDISTTECCGDRIYVGWKDSERIARFGATLGVVGVSRLARCACTVVLRNGDVIM